MDREKEIVVKKIAIIGCGGAGKSTLARQLGEITGMEVLHLDRLQWRPGWTSTPQEEWRNVVEELVQKDSWIIDGNYSATLAIRLAAADTVIFLDYPRYLCLWRVFKRFVQYRNKTRPDMGDGCPERLPDREFLGWIWNFHKRSRPKILQKIEEHLTGKLLHFRMPSETQRWLDDIRHALQKELSPDMQN